MGKAAHDELLRCVAEITAVEDAGGRAILTRNSVGRPRYMEERAAAYEAEQRRSIEHMEFITRPKVPTAMPAPKKTREDLGNGIIIEIDTISDVPDIAIRQLGMPYEKMRTWELRRLLREVAMRLLTQRDEARRRMAIAVGQSLRPTPSPPLPDVERSPRYRAPPVPIPRKTHWPVTALLGFAAGVLATLFATGLSS